jgi:hypothetical protein
MNIFHKSKLYKMKKTNALDTVLLEAGGHTYTAAQHCTDDEALRMKQRGALVFVPTIMACAGMMLTVYYISNAWAVSVAAACVWACIIFAIDKALMASNGSLLSFSAIGRILFAIVNSIVIAECIILLVFADTIKEKRHEVLQSKVDTIAMKYNVLKNQEAIDYSASKGDVENKLSIFTKEIDGSGGSVKRGWGIIGNEKHKAYVMAKNKCTADSIKYNTEIMKIDSIKNEEINAYLQSNANDIAGQLKTLASIDDAYIKIAVWLLRLLLLLVEMMPIFLKYSSAKPSDMYDKVLLLQANKLLEEFKLTAKLDLDILGEKSNYTESTAKVKASYDHNLAEMDMYNAYINAMMAKWQNEMTTKQATFDKAAMHEIEFYDVVRTMLDRKWVSMLGKVG